MKFRPLHDRVVIKRIWYSPRARACARYGVLVVGEESYRDFRQKYARDKPQAQAVGRFPAENH
jgi:co-chaperonin GroES (HSP10)